MSVKSVQVLSTAVQKDIQSIHQICPVTSIRAAKFMKKWGAEQLRHTMQKLQRSQVFKAFRQWNDLVAHLKRVEKRKRYQKNKATRRLDLFLSDWSRRGMAHGWQMWCLMIAAQKEKEFKEVAAAAALVIQNAYRGMAGRKWLHALRVAKYKKQLDEAACIIQNMARRKAGYKIFAMVKEARAMEKAARSMQNVFRGRKTRILFRAMQQQKREKKAVHLHGTNLQFGVFTVLCTSHVTHQRNFSRCICEVLSFHSLPSTIFHVPLAGGDYIEAHSGETRTQPFC